jgi:FdhD protein
MNDTSVGVELTKVADRTVAAATDVVAAEEPLEIRLDGTPFVVIMRTPGADRELTAGFLLAEGLIRDADDLGTIRHCTDPDAADRNNVVNVTLAGEAVGRVAERLAGRRMVTSNSSCGICGRQTIDDLMTRTCRVEGVWRTPARVVRALPDRLRAAQSVFEETGGLHAAGLFDRDGTLVAIAEDVGRHNAVDKVVGGQLLMERLPLTERILMVSGRTSFEIVQKAVAAGVPFLASVSAPSSLAIDLARDAGVTLVGFVRGATFNVYTGVERLDL